MSVSILWGSVDRDQRGPWQSHGTRLRSHYHTCPGSCSDGHLLGFERSQGYFRKVKQHKGPFMGFYTETNPVSHSQVVRSVYNPQFCLHLITVILFVCMLLYPPGSLDSVCHSPSRFITGDSFLTHCGIVYGKVGWSSLSCLFTRPCCKDCLLASAP